MRATLCYVLLWAMFVAGCVDTLTETSFAQEARIGDVCWTSGGRTCCIVDGATVCDGQTIATEGDSLFPRCWFGDDYMGCCGGMPFTCFTCSDGVCETQLTIEGDTQEMRSCWPDGFCCIDFDNGDYLCCRSVEGGTTCYTSL